MDNDKAFGIYAAALVGGILSVVTASVMAGVTALPSLTSFVEHVSLSLLFRAAYKSFDGPYGVMATLREQLAERLGGAAASGDAGAEAAG